MEFWVDNTKIIDPTPDDIARGFNSIGGKNAFSAGISIVQLFRDPKSSLTISGHPADGWIMPSFEEAGRDFSTSEKTRLSQAEAIALFQSYLAGDDSWKKKFTWEETTVTTKSAIASWFFVVTGFAILVYLGRSC